MMLRHDGRGEAKHGGRGKRRASADHAAAPSVGLTVTTRIMPAVM